MTHRRPTARLLRTVVLAAAATMAPAAASAQAAGALTIPDNPLSGRLLFESKQCNRCHGLAGVAAGTGPSLGEGRFRGSFLDLGAAMWNHVPGMTVRFAGTELTWPYLSESEVVELASFLYAIEYLGRPGDAAAGQRLFGSRGCSACHSLGGAGRGGGPDLATLQGFASPLFVAQAIWNHGPTMLASMRASRMPPPVFQDGDLADLSAFVRQSTAAGAATGALLAPGNPNHGRELLAAKGCVACHTVRGRGGAGGPDLARSDLHRSAEGIAGVMWNHALAMDASMRARGMSWPQFTPAEFADLVAYLYFAPFLEISGNAKRGAEVFAQRSCADCHVTGATGGHPGPALAHSQAAQSPAALVATMWNHAPVMREAILGAGHPWPELTGAELRDLYAYVSDLGRSR